MNISINDLKAQARRLRDNLATSGNAISHGQALELVAHQHGHRDWNTAAALAGNRPEGPPVTFGQKVRGQYLGQEISGQVIGVHSLHDPARWRVTLQLDEPVDVVKFDSFSAFRSRITASIDRDGITVEKTSDGEPHLRLHLK